MVALAWEGNALRGQLQVLETPAGAALLRAFLGGQQLGVSTRGWARPQPAGAPGVAAAADFQLVAFDVVPWPATPGASLWPLACAASAGAAGVVTGKAEAAPAATGVAASTAAAAPAAAASAS